MPRWPLVLIGVIIGFCIFGVIRFDFSSNNGSSQTLSKTGMKLKTSEKTGTDGEGNLEKSWMELAKAARTDKFHSHHFECLYETALAPYRHTRRLKMLEIGLGCGMNFGVGASYKLWTTYFLDVDLYIMEYDEKCGKKWFSDLKERLGEDNTRLPTMIYGDQSNRTALREMALKHGPWEVIVDDGGHWPKMIIHTFEELFPNPRALQANGIFFIEDLHKALDQKRFGGTKTGLSTGKTETPITMISKILASSYQKKGIGARLKSMTCCSKICSFLTTSS